VHGLSASELLQGLKSKGVRSPDVSRALGRRREYVCERGLMCMYSGRVCVVEEGGCGGGGWVWWRRVCMYRGRVYVVEEGVSESV